MTESAHLLARCSHKSIEQGYGNMKRMKHLLAATLAIAALSAGMAAQAHGIWFAQRAKQTALIYGVGADDLDMVKRLGLITGTYGYDADWAPVGATLRATGPIVVVDSEAPTVAVAAAMDNGLWSRLADGKWVKGGRDTVPDAVRAERTMKFAVHLTGTPNAPIPVLPEQLLQIVPVDKAIPAEMGKPLTIRVLYKGKPVKDAEVKHDYVNDPDQPPVKTDKDGVATIKVRNQGLNVLAATYVGPADNPKQVDHVEYLATLSFVLAHAPE
jgi:nickel transport protein